MSDPAPQLFDFVTPDEARAAENPRTIGRFHREPHDTEVESAVAQYPKAHIIRTRVLDALKAAGEWGATDYELGWGLRLMRHSAGTRRKELADAGANIVDSGRRRATDTGRSAIVWVYRP